MTIQIKDLSISKDLNAGQLSKVAGGMSCGDALNLADGYLAISSVMGVLGMPSLEAAYAGKASGLIEGACK